jgi:cation diffusion facilitator family transporter
MPLEPSPQKRLSRSLGATFLGLAINLCLAVGKTVAGILGHSQALIADGVESFADIFSSIIVWRGLVIAAAPADKEHPYGHGKAEPIASAIVALLLLAAAIWITVQSVQEIVRPHETPSPYTLVVLAIVVIVKESMFRRVLQTGRELESTAVRSDAWHHRSDAITSVAAAIGISIAVIGGKGLEWADDVAAVLASGIIAWNGWRILRPALDELMDTSPSEEMLNEIKKVASAVGQVDGVEKCAARKQGYYYLVDLHVQVHPQMTVEDSHNVAHQVKAALKASIPSIQDVLVHIEPAQGPSSNS